MERRATVLILVFAAAMLAGVRWLAPAAVNAAPSSPSAIPPLLVAACAVAAGALLLAAVTITTWRKLVPLMLVACVAVVAGLTVHDPWFRLAFLEFGALVTISLVWQNAKTQSTRIAYATVVVVSAASLALSELLAEHGQPGWSRALLFTSVCVKLAAIPLFFWLLKLADEVPALVLGAIIAVVDMAAFGEFCVASQASPFALAPQALWIYIAVGTSLLAALLMLTQRSLKRLLVLSTVEDVGFLLLGAASMSAIGAQGALIAATTHALAKALLFICLAAPEAAGALETEPIALAVRYPVSAFGFLFGMLAMLGVPPTLGFIGRWRLYSVALEIGIWPLVILICSSVFALIAYALALSRNWWGPPGESASPPGPTAREPFALQAAIVMLTILLVAAGAWPNALHLLMGVRP
jgi:multicomponent Na+:H+ antiporter subunit D